MLPLTCSAPHWRKLFSFALLTIWCHTHIYNTLSSSIVLQHKSFHTTFTITWNCVNLNSRSLLHQFFFFVCLCLSLLLLIRSGAGHILHDNLPSTLSQWWYSQHFALYYDLHLSHFPSRPTQRHHRIPEHILSPNGYMWVLCCNYVYKGHCY